MIQTVDKSKTAIVASMKKLEAEHEAAIPAGYALIELSTKGLVGAPAKFHIRNFKTSEVLALSLTEESALPEKVLTILKDCIFEDVDVFAFHEKEVIETIVLLFATFYTSTLSGVPFQYSNEDLAFLESLGEEGKNRVEDLLSGRWKPTVDISIQRDVDTYQIDPSTFKPNVKITDRETGFSCEYRLPRYGDAVLLRKWLREYFEEKEKGFARLKSIIDVKASMIDRYQRGEYVDINRIPVISEEELESYSRFQEEKALILVDAIKAMHIVAFDGQPVDQLPLSERLSLVQDSRLDFTYDNQIDEHFNKLQFGIKPTVFMRNPITGADREERRYSFRLFDILQAMQLQGSHKYDVVFS
jgi:hypothetical protein